MLSDKKQLGWVQGEGGGDIRVAGEGCCGRLDVVAVMRCCQGEMETLSEGGQSKEVLSEGGETGRGDWEWTVRWMMPWLRWRA